MIAPAALEAVNAVIEELAMSLDVLRSLRDRLMDDGHGERWTPDQVIGEIIEQGMVLAESIERLSRVIRRGLVLQPTPTRPTPTHTLRQSSISRPAR